MILAMKNMNLIIKNKFLKFFFLFFQTKLGLKSVITIYSLNKKIIINKIRIILKVLFLIKY